MIDDNEVRRRLSAGILTRRRVELASFFDHEPSSAALGNGSARYEHTGPESWISGLWGFGADCMVCAALGATGYAYSLLDDAPWVVSSSEPLVRPAITWLQAPSTENAKECAAAARESEKIADLADERTTDQGDWWSYEAVQTISLIPSAIAMYSGVMLPTWEVPGPPKDDLEFVCRYFCDMERDSIAFRAAVSAYVVPWALGEPDALQRVLDFFVPRK